MNPCSCGCSKIITYPWNEKLLIVQCSECLNYIRGEADVELQELIVKWNHKNPVPTKKERTKLLNPCSCGCRFIDLHIYEYDKTIQIRCSSCHKYIKQPIAGDIHDELDEIIHKWNTQHPAPVPCACGGTTDDKFYCPVCLRQAASAEDCNKIVKLTKLLLQSMNRLPARLVEEILNEVSSSFGEAEERSI